MNIKRIVQSAFFYGLLFYLTYCICVYFSPEIQGVTYSKIIGIFAVITGVIQSLSFAIFSKLAAAYQLENITCWSKNILDNNISNRRELLKHRFFFGMIGSLIIAILAAVGYLIKDGLVSNVLISMAITLILVVTVSLFITFREYFSLEKLVHDLSEKARKIEQKQKFLKN